MPIANTDLVAYCCLDRPTDDITTTGGGIDATVRPIFTQLTASAIIEVVSSGADTRTVTIVGRDPAGVKQTTTLILNGTTPVDGVQTYERILSVMLDSTSASETVTVKQGSGGTTVATIPPNEKGIYALFENAASSSSPETRYEKIFWKNANGSLALTSAQVELTLDDSATLEIGLAAAVDDTTTTTNRTTAPAGVSFVGLSTAQGVPGGYISPGSAIGVWLKQSLAANQAPTKASFTTQLSGQTT